MDSEEDRLQARKAAAAAMKPNGGLPDGLDRWRAGHPYRCFSWRVEKTGGWVFVAHDGAVYYWGRCRECLTGHVTAKRRATKGRGLGRWPELCCGCRDAKAEESRNQTNRRMQNLRNPGGVDDLRRLNNHPDPRWRN